MKQIGLTGGIGSGKSTVARFFELLGIPVFNSDLMARKIIETNAEVKSQIKTMFGNDAYFEDGKLNSAFVAETTFSNQEKLNQLNALVHPLVRQAYQKWMELQNSSYVITEAAILIESGRFKDLDGLICVNAPENLRIERVMKRSQLNHSDILQRISNQMNDEKRSPFCTHTITNDDLQAIIPQVLAIHHLIKNK